jgi:hypothetical protein
VIGDEIYLLGGDEGNLSGKIDPAKHPGFSKKILIYKKLRTPGPKRAKCPPQ